MDDFDGLDENSNERIRLEIQNLIKRGNVTPAELSEIRCNSWEWEALVPAMNNEALVERTEHALENCSLIGKRPFPTYNESVMGLLAPELLKRFAVSTQETQTRADVIDGICKALGRKPAHPLAIADDVKELVEAIESRCDALAVLKRIREKT